MHCELVGSLLNLPLAVIKNGEVKTMSAHTIPVLDLSAYNSGTTQERKQFIEELGRSLSDVGFFALTNHGIAKTDIDASYKATANLFDLPDTIKAKYEIPGIKGQRAYTSFGKEHAKDSSVPDLKEFWHIGQELSKDHPLAASYPENVWPSEIDNFRSTMLNIYKKLDQCALTLLEACSQYLDEDKNLIRDMAQDGNSILRLIHYPPVPQDANPQSVRAAAHEDINLITLLIDATASGLEILDRNNNWIPVVTPKDCIIVDSGDMLQNLTNGFFKSTTHRVVNPDDNRSRRFSMPFFVHARSEVRLDPLQSCIEKKNGVRHHPNITAGEYLHQRLVEIGLA